MPAQDAPTAPLGSLSGGWRFGNYVGWVTDVLEYVPDLVWPTSVWTYGKMRHDTNLASVLAAYIQPMLRAKWAIDPRGADPGIVAICADSLGLPVVGAPDDPGASRRRGVQWREHLRMAFLSLVFGHIGFEPVYEIRDGKAYIKALPERLPQTISTIHVDANGYLQGVSQSATPGQIAATIVGQGVELPYDEDPALSRLLWYVNAKEGASWQGQSILRACFGPWLIKQDMLRVQGTALRRFGAGTPVMEPIPGFTPTPAQIAEAQRMAQSVRVGETGGATTPGFSLHIKGIEGTVPDALGFIRYLDEQMARSALASALDLASTAHGSRALGISFMDLLGMAQQGVAEMIAVTATRLCVALTDFNEGPDATAPGIVVSDVTANERVLAESLALMVHNGALVMDDDLQAYLRQILKLPAPKPIAPPAPPTPPPAPTPPPPNEPAQPPGSGVAAASPRYQGRVRVGDTAWPYRRELNTIELKAGLDPLTLDEQTSAIVADLMTAWPSISTAQMGELAEQVGAALEAGDPSLLTSMTVNTDPAAARISDAILAAAKVGVASALDEADSQGVAIDEPELDEDALTGRAAALAALIGASFAGAAGREALRLWDTTRTSTAVVDDVMGHLDSLSATFVRDQLAGAVNGGVNDGRMTAMAAAPVDPIFSASEIRDANTCEPCAAIDGHEFGSQEEADAAYPTGGYGDCDGGPRCRGIIVATYPDGTAAEE